MCLHYKLLYWLCLWIGLCSASAAPPNIVFILADDLGFNDVGYHNEDVISPNLDALAKDGLILDQNYVQPLCSPSRSALMTGMYPYHIGRQTGVIKGPTGLTLEKTLLPEALKTLGYNTHMIGKWHLGHCNTAYLPVQRGFDSHYGYWSGSEDYYTKTVKLVYVDFHEGNDILNSEEITTTYSSFLYRDRATKLIRDQAEMSPETPLFLYVAMQNVHTPLEAPEEYLNMYPDTLEADRRTYLAMVTALDDVVGNITFQLKESGLYDNTVIIFSSDNGSPKNGGSNLPLNGYKGEVFEGGTRVPAFVHSPGFLTHPDSITSSMFHITDWFPTLLHLAGASSQMMQELTGDLDGMDQYELFFGQQMWEERQEIVYNIEAAMFGSGTKGAIRAGDWKLHQIRPTSHLLYNLKEDPNETLDLAEAEPVFLDQMLAKYEELAASMVPADNPDGTDDGYEDGQVVTGWCEV